jgi:hypothetical protein
MRYAQRDHDVALGDRPAPKTGGRSRTVSDVRTQTAGTSGPESDLEVDIELGWEPGPEDRADDRPGADLSGSLGRLRFPRAEMPTQLRTRPYAMLRLPGAWDPAPQAPRMIGMCAWATTLGLIGLAVAIRALLIIISAAPPWWFEPAVVSTGLVGIGLAAGAFMAVHRRRLPWLMLTAATAMLILTVTLTSST